MQEKTISLISFFVVNISMPKLNWKWNTVEPLVSDHPKGKDLEVAYGLTGGGLL